jgi:hypothetical protein
MKSEAILIATVAVIATKSSRFSLLLSRNGQDSRNVESSAKLAFVINHYMHRFQDYLRPSARVHGRRAPGGAHGQEAMGAMKLEARMN